MKRLATSLCLFVAISLPAIAVEDGQVMYSGGTPAGIKIGTIGRLDTSSQTALAFECPGNKLSIPYVAIDSYECSREVKRHLGVLPAIAIGLVKQRQRRHFFRISYHDEQNSPQVAIFEVSKHMPLALKAILQSRAPQGCKVQGRCPHCSRSLCPNSKLQPPISGSAQIKVVYCPNLTTESQPTGH